MTAEEFQKFLSTVCHHYRQIAKLGASLYICHASSWQREFQNALEEAGFEIRCQIISTPPSGEPLKYSDWNCRTERLLVQ